MWPHKLEQDRSGNAAIVEALDRLCSARTLMSSSITSGRSTNPASARRLANMGQSGRQGEQLLGV